MLFIAFFALIPFAVAVSAYAHSSAEQSESLARRASATQIRSFLSAHNTVRAAHNATALTWSTEYAARAVLWAEGCDFALTGGVLSTQTYGELHTAATGPFTIPTAIGEFTADQGGYNPDDPTYNHFTQIVWKSTTEVGCAEATCNNLFGLDTGSATYYVCLYYPAGNVVGQAA
ncbi:hypothetical protein H0H92_004881 [Tricholoma furcatifolium]|nr:hypothetical protein H0H92_004881 [Tricholoma furcatifolium]